VTHEELREAAYEFSRKKWWQLQGGESTDIAEFLVSFAESLPEEGEGDIRKTYRTRRTVTPDVAAEVFEAARGFLASAAARCDAVERGAYPLWYGWALLEAFVAGWKMAGEKPPPPCATCKGAGVEFYDVDHHSAQGDIVAKGPCQDCQEGAR
jgi:hypothetical protein